MPKVVQVEHFDRPTRHIMGLPINGGRSPGLKPGASVWTTAAFYANAGPVQHSGRFPELIVESEDEVWKFTNVMVAMDPMVEEAPYRFMVMFEKCEKLLVSHA